MIKTRKSVEKKKTTIKSQFFKKINKFDKNLVRKKVEDANY